VSTEQLLADLDALDALFSDESKWARGNYARDAKGRPAFIGGAEAVAWCLVGGCIRITRLAADKVSPLETALCRTLDGRDYGSLAPFNDDDGRTFADIKNLISSTRARIAQEAAK